ncbi:MAG: nucleoside hydrolase [Opitutales bacterium]
MSTPVIFDTDAGSDIDDLYALALLLAHPAVSLQAVTTVAGDTQARARLVAKMLRLAGRPDVPVLAGIRLPEALARQGVVASDYRQNLTHADLVGPDDPEYDQQYDTDAVGFILRLLSQTRVPVTLIGTGPWTNIAEVLRLADESRRAAIGSLALMGGEVHRMHAESNVKHDPEAAARVLSSGVPTFLATWSVSRELFFTMEEIDRLAGPEEASPFVRALRAGTRLWWDRARPSKPGPVCYDVLPVFWAVGEREGIQCIRLDSLPVEQTGSYTRGMTVVSPWELMRASRTDQTAPACLTVTDSLEPATLKQRFTDWVFGQTAGKQRRDEPATADGADAG